MVVEIAVILLINYTTNYKKSSTTVCIITDKIIYIK